MDQRRAGPSVGGTSNTSSMRSNGEARTAPTPEQLPNPFPYPGARGLVTTGKVAQPVQASSEFCGLLAQAVVNTADAITVELFGNQQQRNEVHAWMRRNGERR